MLLLSEPGEFVKSMYLSERKEICIIRKSIVEGVQVQIRWKMYL
jgi:hypothetical protein